MAWNMEEALAYYKRQGAPTDQTALIGLLKEMQQQNGGRLRAGQVDAVAQSYQVRQSYLLAIIKHIPSLRLEHSHCLEICSAPNCVKRARLAAFVEKTYGKAPQQFTVRYVGCMHQCGKGPNIKWDGTLYNAADETLIRRLVEQKN